MKRISMKKSVFISTIALTMIVSSSAGVLATNGIEKIQAALNHNIKFVVNGSDWSPKDSTGKSLSALVYNGSTYVPLRATGEALGAQINYDPNKMSITINSDNNNGVPYLDVNENTSNNVTNNNSNNVSANENKPTSNQGKVTSATATSTDPVPLGQSFKFKDIYEDHSKKNKYEAEYNLSIRKVTTISSSDYSKYRLQADSKYDYVALNIKLDLIEAKMLKTDYVDGAYGTVYFYPSFVGTDTPDTETVFHNDYGFDGALEAAVSKAFNFKKFKVGEKASYSVEGVVIVAVIKNKSNNLMIRNENTDAGSNAKTIYFKIN